MVQENVKGTSKKYVDHFYPYFDYIPSVDIFTYQAY